MDWAWPAIVIGALVIVTRGPLIFRPPETLALYRGLWATDARLRGMSGLYLAMGLACFWAAARASGVPLQLLVFLGALLLLVTAWTLFAPAHFRSIADGVFSFIEESVDTAAIRGLGAVAVSVGLLLVYAGVRAL